MTTVTIDEALKIALEHHNAGRLGDAEAVYARILEAQPRNASALYLLGRLRAAQGQPEAAAALLAQAVDAKPDFVDALLSLSTVFKELGRASEALTACQRALLHDPKNLQALSATLSGLMAQAVQPFDTPHGPIRFLCMDHLPLFRAQSLMTKEPETLEWIEAFDAGDVFWDVGANVGVYTLYAAKAGKAGQVLAFEPSAGNYMLLNRNIEVNGFDSVAKAYCIAFSDADLLGDMHMQSTELGGALSSFDTPIDFAGQQYTAKFRQGMLGLSIDSFVRTFAPPFPNHLKIDVDGIEDRIVAGATATLADPRLKSLSIELDEGRPDYTGAVVARIEAAGLTLISRRHAPMFENSPYAKIYNFQFRRA